jgi:hypothetical protein
MEMDFVPLFLGVMRMSEVKGRRAHKSFNWN